MWEGLLFIAVAGGSHGEGEVDHAWRIIDQGGGEEEELASRTSSRKKQEEEGNNAGGGTHCTLQLRRERIGAS